MAIVSVLAFHLQLLWTLSWLVISAVRRGLSLDAFMSGR